MLHRCLLAVLFSLAILSTTHANDWPQWRGPDRDGTTAEQGLLDQWPEDGPKVVWRVGNVGVGFSSIAIADGRIFTQGDLNGVEHIIALSEKNGEMLWKVTPGGEGFENNQGDGPRGTPTVDGDRVYTVGGNGDVMCLDAQTGEQIWRKHLVRDLGGQRPRWGYSESPLVLGDMLIVTPGGEKGMVAALNKNTGDVIWRSQNMQQGAQYTSAQVAELAGVRQIVQVGSESVFGLDPQNGRLLWRYDEANNGTANICMPVIHDDHVFASSAYGTGGGLVKITRDGDGFNAEQVYFTQRMANHHGGIVRMGDHMYGFSGAGLICMDYMTGEIAWRDRSVNKGSLIYADGMLYCLGEGQEVALVEANPERYIEHGRFRIDDMGRPSWAHFAIANGRLYLRNMNRLTAYDIADRRAVSAEQSR